MLDYRTLSEQINIAGLELLSQHNDGYTDWEIKQGLYKLKWLIDEILIDSPKFICEEEFLIEYSKKKMWDELKK